MTGARTSPVAFDAGPAKAQPTGVGVYVRELALALQPHMGDRLQLIGARQDGPLADGAATTMEGSVHVVWVLRHADRDARGVGASLAHYTNAVAPLRSSLPFVLTIQDLSLIRYPRYHPLPRLGVVPVMAWAARHAQRVITPSRATADEVARLLHVAVRRIDVVELAPVGGSFPTQAERATVLRDLDLAGRRFLLSLATIEPRKNIDGLIRGFERVAAKDRDISLVLGGGSGWRTATIERAIAASPAADRIRRLGYVSDLARAVLLTECAAFVYVSLYEGYGLPVVEAMQSGAPVVTSNVSSMPEAAGGAAVLVDPLDDSSIAEGIRTALRDADDLREAGLARAAQLSWERTAGETERVYEAATARWV